MPGTKEIRTKIASVKSTQKITKAMEMVATSKMRRAQERMRLARPYAEKMRNVIGHLNEANPDYRHPFLRRARAQGGRHHRDLHRPRPLPAASTPTSSSRRCMLMREWQGKGAQREPVPDRQQGADFLPPPRACRSSPASPGLGDRPHVKDLIGTVKVMLDAYREGKIDRLFLVQRAVRQHHDAEAGGAAAAADRGGRHRGTAGALGLHLRAGRRGDPRRPADALHRVAGLPGRGRERRLRDGGAHGGHEGRLRQRRQAHQRAAAVYNKARQAAITKELSEIVGGAAAV